MKVGQSGSSVAAEVSLEGKIINYSQYYGYPSVYVTKLSSCAKMFMSWNSVRSQETDMHLQLVGLVTAHVK
jgi:hypothetical protein